MSDALTTITKLINSPPGQIAAGGVLAGIVWKFFERVEALLTEQTKFEIAVWLVGRKRLGLKVQPWPETFATVFDRVFGAKHLSWKCFWRSCIASISLVLLFLALTWRSELNYGLCLFLLLPFTNAIPDYITLLVSRLALKIMVRTQRATLWLVLLLLVLGFTLWLSAAFVFTFVRLWIHIGNSQLDQHLDISAAIARNIGWNILSWLLHALLAPSYILPYLRPEANMKHFDSYLVLPAFFTSIWLWLYAGSGFILKSAIRFDIGFDWFNRKFDIEKKPLQSIGLVAGALVAVVYWAAAVVGRWV